MLRICICDDAADSRTLIRYLCDDLLGRLGLEGVFFERTCAEGLLADFPEHLDVIFIDVIMGGMTGVEAAREIRKQDTSVTLVFMSNYAQYAVEGYSVQAYRYLLKPVTATRFDAEMRSVFTSLAAANDASFTVRNDAGIFAVPPKDIRYIDTVAGGDICFHMVGGEIVCRDALKRWEENLAPYGFFRCHNAYLVNLACVRAVLSEGFLALTDDKRIPVSRHRRKDLEDALASYVSGKL